MSAELIFSNPIVNGSGARRGQTCSVELLGLAIYGDLRHGDHLPCIDAGCQSAFRNANDATSTEVKQTRRWRLLLARLSTCHETGNDRVRRRMALWSARSVEHLNDDPRVKACNDGVDAFLAGEITAEQLAELRSAAYAAYAADADAAYAAYAAAAYAAAAAADAADADADAAAAADAADADAADAAAYAYAADADVLGVDRQKVKDEAYMDWLDRYLTAWQKVAADEGCMVPEDMDAEYVAFVDALDWTTGREDGGE